MSYVTGIPFQMIGPTYQSRAKPLSSQQTINWYPQLDQRGKDAFVLLPFPGLKEFGQADGIDRGLHQMGELLYQVKGTALYEISSTGTHTNKGSIPGVSRCIMADDSDNLYIVSTDERKVYRYTKSTDSLAELTDANITGSKSVAFINNFFLYTKDRFTGVSNAGDGSIVQGNNIIGAETNPDDLVRDYVFEQTIYRMGKRSIESWYVSGVGNPPIDIIQGQIFDVGLKAIQSVAQTDEAFYFLGDDDVIYRARSGTKERISADGISNYIQGLSRSDDAIGWTFTIEGQNFYAITFPTGGRTFVISEKLGINGWFELSSGLDGGIYQCSTGIRVYGKNVFADRTNGKLYTLDFDSFTNDGETLKRTRVTNSVDGTLLNPTFRGSRLGMSKMEIIMETGIGTISGQGENPRILIEYSDDGGFTWTHGAWPRVGRLGERTLRVEFFELSTFYERMFRITTTDPVSYSIFAASIDLRKAGK